MMTNNKNLQIDDSAVKNSKSNSYLEFADNSQISSYVKHGNLYIFGLINSKFGYVPFTYRCKTPDDVRDGPVNFGSEGLPKSFDDISEKIQKGVIKEIDSNIIKLGAESLVIRGRNGDQNALAILMHIRENALKGDVKAKKGLRAVKLYIKENPNNNDSFSGDSLIVKELPKHLNSDTDRYSSSTALFGPVSISFSTPENIAVIFCNGTKITKFKIQSLIEKLNPSYRRSFIKGLNNKGNRSPANMLGRIIRYAKSVQMVRSGAPIKVLSKTASWELGE